MLPNFRNARFGAPPSPSPSNAPFYPFRSRPPLSTRWNGRESRAADTASPVSVSPLVSPMMQITVSDFITVHTKPAASRSSNGECPICLEAYNAEDCLQITGIAGCSHFIGSSCLKDMFKHRRLEAKKCPLCRTVWVPCVSSASTPPRTRRQILSRAANALFSLGNHTSNTARSQVQAENAASSDSRSVSRSAQLPRSSPCIPPELRNIRRSDYPTPSLHTSPELRNISRPEYPSQRQEVTSISSLSDRRFNEDRLARYADYSPASRNRAMEKLAEIRRLTEVVQHQKRMLRKRQFIMELKYRSDCFRLSSDDILGEPGSSRTISSDSTHEATTNAANCSCIVDAHTPSSFRSAARETAPSAAAMEDSVNSIDTREGVARAQHQPNARVSELHNISGHGTTEMSPTPNNTSSPHATLAGAPLRIPSLGSSVEVTAARSDHQLPSTIHWANPISVGGREQRSEGRRNALDARHINLRRCEETVTERTNSVERILAHVRRQQEELDELVRRHRQELESILDEYSSSGWWWWWWLADPTGTQACFGRGEKVV